MKRRPSWIKPPAWAPSESDYHAAPSWGSSKLKTFRESPALAWHYYVARDIAPPDPSPEMILGSLVHLLLLEPDRYNEAVHVVPVQKRAGKLWAAAVGRYRQKLVVPQPFDQKARAIAESILHPKTRAAEVAHSLLLERPGAAEYSYAWDDETGVPCRIRFDWLCDAPAPTMVNVKTTRDPTPKAFARHAYDLGYHAQQAFYERGAVRMAGEIPVPLIVAVRNDEPYEVAVFQPSEQFMELGRRQIRADLARLGELLKTPERAAWCAPWEEEIEVLGLPPWARINNEDQVVDLL